ncbi:MAG: triose-phosphate isomerase [Dehalococcoidales bacterium]|nr:triose-phosphate isomerase [Dehalococcoidales bacterium]
MRLPLIAGNWKMNTNLAEAVKLVNDMRPHLDAIHDVEKVVCPPFISLSAVHEILKGSQLKVGAQNLHFEEKGAFTGEISPLMLTGLCEYVILGHSERRQYFQETDEVVNKKLKTALKFGLKPILCVGEKLAEYEDGLTSEVVTGQLKASLKDVTLSENLVVAYEPIWAIGTGKAANGTQANAVISRIRKIIQELSTESTSQCVRILYGGSVTMDNIQEFAGMPAIDGALVGGASLKPDQFISIVKQTAQINCHSQE